MGITAYYLTSLRALVSVETIIAQTEALRDSDLRFNALGIGLAEGELIAEFDWLGRLKKNSITPVGISTNEALGHAKEPQKYKETLRILRERLHESVS